ncbi:MAG: ABC transporter ATP-binding protein [Oscillospiraceae bacterium]|jgi:putative ABC transport system ATP-binding protein|nr:ABC transporter ATP-binding protein [Oscillospiraceae bacterium]
MAGIEIENVSYKYKRGERAVLDSVTCSFSEGGMSAVVGPSGSGKTTLLSIMAGLDAPTGGSVRIDGEDLSSLNLDRYRRERVSMIFQAFHLFPLLTALENVCFPMEMTRAPKAKAADRANELLEMVGISKALHRRYPSNLSGGEQQRVAIARALATGARVILADEPTGNLDKANSDHIVGILKSLAHDDGLCVIVVTHDLEVAEVSDAIYRLSDGVLVSGA